MEFIVKSLIAMVVLFSFQVFSQGYPLPAGSQKAQKPSRISKALKRLESLRGKVNAEDLYNYLEEIQEEQFCFGPSNDHINTKKIGALTCKKTTIQSATSYLCELTKAKSHEDHKSLFNFVSQHKNVKKSFRKAKLPGHTINCEMTVSYTGKSYKCYLGEQRTLIRYAL